MRQSQNGNAKRMRNYKRPLNNGNNGSGVNRVYDSNGPEGRLRGTPMQIYLKYVALAKDAHVSGDNVKAESCLQYADHYNRIVYDALNVKQNNNNNNNNNNRNNNNVQNKEGEEKKPS